MSQGSNTAKKCFDENIRLFANPKIEPEKFNLYNGLHALAEAVEMLEMQIVDLQQRINRLQR